jgi:hypothetical protein
MNWFQEANCRSLRTSDFFDNFEEADVTGRVKILSVCAQCTVRTDCEKYADSFSDTHGVWGGYFYKNGRKRDALKITRPKISARYAEEFIL